MKQHQFEQHLNNYKNFDFAKTAVIKPPFEEFKNKEISNKLTRILIDSRDRNVDIFPSPSCYEIQLDEEIEDVTSAEVLVIDVPFSTYLINLNNNKLSISSGSSANVMVVLPVGDFTGPSLASAIQSSLNKQIGSSFNVLYDIVRDNFTFSSDQPFQFHFKTHNPSYPSNLCKVLGFQFKDMSSEIVEEDDYGYTNFLLSTHRKDFNDNKYIVLHIEQISLNYSNNTTTNKSLVLIPPSYMTLNHSTITPIKKFFNPPIGRLTKLRLTFKDYYGNLYDFQNHDHRIDLLFESNKHLRRFQG
jgi:hypothetical protein